MREYLAQQLQASDPIAGRHIVREVLQAKVMASLQRVGAMIPLAFHGGTSLRFLYSINRFSEDLDFALERPDRDCDFGGYLRAIRADFEREGYALDIKANDRKIVHSAFLRFRGLLYELGLSPHRTEVLAIKVEVDTRPPAGAVLETTVVRRHVTAGARLASGRVDLLVRRPLPGGGVECFAAELKVRRDGDGDPLEDGLEQLSEYLDRLGLDAGTLVLFDQRVETDLAGAREGPLV